MIFRPKAGEISLLLRSILVGSGISPWENDYLVLGWSQTPRWLKELTRQVATSFTWTRWPPRLSLASCCRTHIWHLTFCIRRATGHISVGVSRDPVIF